MNVLSLFDGMACGMLAMQSAGITVDRYVAFEYDEETANEEKGRPYGYAALTSKHNFPMIEHRGDVFQADFTEFSGFDFLVGGSPCTFWSIAQKNNRETEASGMGWELFCQYVRALHEAQPTYFIYENNKSMSNAIRESITRTFGFEPVCINSSLLSAQNRQRLYWVGKRNFDGTYSRVHVQQPNDMGILLRDVLDSATYEAIGIGYRGRQENGAWKKRYESNGEQKANTLTTARTDSMVAETIRVGALPRPNGELSTSQAFRVYAVDGKSVNITAGGGGAGGKTGLYAIPVEFDGDIPTKAVSSADGKTYTVYQVKNGQITIKEKTYPIKLADGFYIIRKLTVSECKRLQTVPKWYEFPCSDAQAYKMLGNGWTVEVIAHLIKATQADEFEEEQLDLFKMIGVTT